MRIALGALALALGLTSVAAQRVEVMRVIPARKLSQFPSMPAETISRFVKYRRAHQLWLLGAPDVQVLRMEVAVPIYFGRPPEPYVMLGWVVMDEDGKAHPKSDRLVGLKDIALTAQRNGAEAIWLRQPEAGHYLEAVAFRWVK